jgi:hypothetical protein
MELQYLIYPRRQQPENATLIRVTVATKSGDDANEDFKADMERYKHSYPEVQFNDIVTSHPDYRYLSGSGLVGSPSDICVDEQAWIGSKRRRNRNLPRNNPLRFSHLRLTFARRLVAALGGRALPFKRQRQAGRFRACVWRPLRRDAMFPLVVLAPAFLARTLDRQSGCATSS